MLGMRVADEECARCCLLDTAWHAIAFHPAIVPPNWEPGNGQSYTEAVLERLNSQRGEGALRAAREQGWDEAAGWVRRRTRWTGDQLRDANPHRAAKELLISDGTVIIPAEGHEYIETRTGKKSQRLTWDAECYVWYDAHGTHLDADIITGTWKVDDQ